MHRKSYKGGQNFAKLREGGWFYVDKTDFLTDWWLGDESGTGDVTLLLRPRRFGKTLMLSTVDHFFSTKYAGRGDLFEGLNVWKNETMRSLQGTVPVIFLSFADIKPSDFEEFLMNVNTTISQVYDDWASVIEPELSQRELLQFHSVLPDMRPGTAKQAIKSLVKYLARHFGKDVIVLLDEYDAPMLEAWTNGFWDKTAAFMHGFLNATFKTNPSLERGLLTGNTQMGMESILSDFNNLNVCSVTDSQYTTSFGFTEEEVFAAMDEHHLTDRNRVKQKYNGFRFGNTTDIYNPWSITCYLFSRGETESWWANSSSNALVGELIRTGDVQVKQQFTTLMEGKTIISAINKCIVFSQLAGAPATVWSLLIAAGYLKLVDKKEGGWELALTNEEVIELLDGLLKAWFTNVKSYKDFVDALKNCDLVRMNRYMNDVASNCFSFFDTGTSKGARGRKKSPPDRNQPERFYHGFVLGLVVELRDSYVITSNLESGNGRYDIMLEPRDPAKDIAFIFEFKVFDDADGEHALEDTVAHALAQIEEKNYAQRLIERGIPTGRIKKYGFAFCGKKVLIGEA